MSKQTVFALALVAAFVGGVVLLGSPVGAPERSGRFVNEALAAQFDYLSTSGNSSCSASFAESIGTMDDSDRLRGSCCSPMSIHRYSEQVEGLKKFKSEPSQNIAKIPDDPYNIEAGLAKELKSYYDVELTPEEQAAYDYAMTNSN